MNAKEFIEEVKSSDICPKDFDLVYPEFQEYQKLAMDALVAFHEVCEKNHIRYQLAFGSLLGAIRDDGQIPWDYDIDVIIPYEERLKLVEALERDLPDDFYFYCPERNEKCRHYFMRVTPKGYRSDRLHVDVFYVIGAPASEEERNSFETYMRKYFQLRYLKLVRLSEFPRNAYRSKLGTLRKKIKSLKYAMNDINAELEKICRKYDPYQTGVTMPAVQASAHYFWNTEKLWDTELISTSAGEFRVTKHYDEILTTNYKDYRKIFPLHLRLNEMYSTYYKLKYNKLISHKKSVGRYYLSK